MPSRPHARRPLRRLLVQLSDETLKSIRVEARRRGTSSRAEAIRALIADGFAFRKWVESSDEPDAPAQN